MTAEKRRYRILTKPFEYQKEGVLEIEEFDGRVLLADEMGLGKTLQALAFLARERVPTFPALVVCPASLKFVWEYEAKTHIGLRAEILSGEKPPPKIGRLLRQADLTVINHDIIRHWVTHLENIPFNTIILDECHAYGNRKSLRTKAVMHLGKGIRNVIGISGTPLTNRPFELWPTLNLIRPDVFGNQKSFAQLFCAPKRTHWGWDFSGASNVPRLHKLLKRSCLVRRLKRDVLKDLPDKSRHTIPIALSDQKQYREAQEDYFTWLKEYHPERATKAMRAQALTKQGDLLRLCSKLKLRGVVDWANQFLEETDEKLVIYAYHKKAIDVLRRRVNSPSVLIDGTVPIEQRKHAVSEFQNNPKTRVFIGNILAAGTGITLTAASTIAFAELWWRPGDLNQCEDRIHRIGQKNTAFINYLVAGGTIEEKLCKIIQKKQEIIRGVLDGQVFDDDLNIADQLVRELKNAEMLSLSKKN